MKKVITKKQELSRNYIEMIANKILDIYKFKGKVLILLGSGNSALYGYALALHLKENKIDVNILIVEENNTNLGKYYLKKCKNKVNLDDNLNNYDIIVDAIYGMELKPISKHLKEIINQINNSKKKIISLDMNTGLNPYNGMANICIHSNITISIGALKPGHLLNMAKDNIDKLINIETNIEDEKCYLLEKEDFLNFIPNRKHFSNKGNFGKVGILGGSLKYSGSVKLALSSLISLTSGAGLARIIVPNKIASSLISLTLEQTIFPVKDKNGEMIFDKNEIDEALKGLTALLIGIGWDRSENNKKILTYILENYDIPIVIDADGLNTLAQINYPTKSLILTPHLKEFSRLTGLSIQKISENPIQIAKDYAKKHQIILLLKGPTTIITDGEIVYLVDKGSSGMAKAGSGDVLSGIIIGLLGYKKPNIKTIAFAAYINGLAGEYAEKEKTAITMLARDTIDSIDKAIKPYIKK